MSTPPADKCKVPHAFWHAVEANGIPSSALLRQARLPATAHLTGQSLTTAQYFALMRALEELSSEPALGIKMIETAPTSVHPPSTLAAFHARDYRDGLERLARFKRLCTPEALVISEADGVCTITIDWFYAIESEPDISIDFTFATLMELGRRSTGKPIRPHRVDYARPGPKIAAYDAYFKAPVRYGAARDALVLDCDDLDRPFPGHNPELLAMLTPVLGGALADLGTMTIAEQVVAALKRGLPSGRPDVAEIARELGMSERTMQRRITDEGTTFRDLLAEARKDLGRRLLSNETVQIEEVAYLLGYQDTTSFHRAFREWEGMSPGRWREHQVARSEATD